MMKQPKKVEVSLTNESFVSELKRRHSTKGSLKAQQEFAEELIRRGEEVKEKKRALAESLEHSNLRHSMHRNSKNLNGRTFDDFLEEQNIFLDKKESRVKIVRHIENK